DLSALHCNWRGRGDSPGCFLNSSHQLIVGVTHFGDQPLLKRFWCSEMPPCHGRFAHPTVISDNLGQSIEHADIRGHAQCYLLQRELSFLGAVSNVAGCCDVQRDAECTTSRYSWYTSRGG
ncbi:hypothetical protein PMAYCL1PPCAC_16826, partial [Pristionchus mayeri]